MKNIWKSLLKDSGEDKEHNSLKVYRTIIFSQNSSTLRQFFGYVDKIHPDTPDKLADTNLILSPIGFYTKEIFTDEGWTLRLEFVSVHPPKEKSDLEYVLAFFGDKNLKKLATHLNCVLLLDWTNEDQSYWLEDMVLCESAARETLENINFSIMMINCDYSKRLERSYPKWTSSTVDFMHQSFRTAALALDFNIFSDLKTPLLATKGAIGISVSTEDITQLLDFAIFANCNILRGSDSTNKILLIDGQFPLTQFFGNIQRLMMAFRESVPIISERKVQQTDHRFNKNEIDEVVEPSSISVQEKLSKLYLIQRQKFQNNDKLIAATEKEYHGPHSDDISMVGSNLEESVKGDVSYLETASLETIVEGIVQRHQMS